MLTSEQLATVVAALESQIERLQDLKELHDYLNGEGYTEQQLSPVTDALAAVNAMAGVEVVPDGMYGEHDTITISGNGTFVEIRSAFGDGSRRHNAMMPLPHGWALIRTSEGGE